MNTIGKFPQEKTEKTNFETDSAEIKKLRNLISTVKTRNACAFLVTHRLKVVIQLNYANKQKSVI